MKVHNTCNRTEVFIPMTGNKNNYKIKISFRCKACPFLSFKYSVCLNVLLLTLFITDFMYYVYNVITTRCRYSCYKTESHEEGGKIVEV